jgi:iturin family lipopeptide synthetase A
MTARTTTAAMAAQEYFWYLRQSDPEPSSYALPLPLEIVGPLDRVRLQHAVERAINDREVFRTAFREHDGRLFQSVEPDAPRFALEIVDRTALPDAERAAEIARTTAELAPRLDLAAGVLALARLLVLGPERHVLVLVMAHAICDGGTILLLVREIFASYRSGTAEADAARYLDHAAAFVRFVDSREGRERLAWWQERLRAARPLALPFDFARAPVDARRTAAHHGIVAEPMHAMHTVEVPAPLRQELVRVAKTHKVPASIVYLAAYLRVLHELAHQDDLLVETVYDPRADGSIEQVLGPIATWTYMRFDLAAARTTGDVLAIARQGMREAMEHSLIPDQFTTVPSELRGTCFNYVPVNSPTSKYGDITVSRLPYPFPLFKRHWQLMLLVVDSSRGGLLNWTGNQRLWRRETIVDCARRYLGELDRLLTS